MWASQRKARKFPWRWTVDISWWSGPKCHLPLYILFSSFLHLLARNVAEDVVLHPYMCWQGLPAKAKSKVLPCHSWSLPLICCHWSSQGIFASRSGATSLDGASPPLFAAVTPEEGLTGLSLNCSAFHNYSSISVFLNSARSGKANFGHRE